MPSLPPRPRRTFRICRTAGTGSPQARKAKEKDKADLQKRLDTIGRERAKLAGEKDLAEFAKLRKLRRRLKNGAGPP